MKKPLIFFTFSLIYISISSFPVVVNSQNTTIETDLCGSKLNVSSQFPFDTTSLNCNPVWSKHGYLLRYVQAEPTVWNFVLTAPLLNSYVAIGFSPNGKMVGSSAIVGWSATGGISTIKKYFLGGQRADMVEPDKSDLIIGNSTIVVENSKIHLAFQLVNTSTPLSRLIYAIGPDGILPSTNNRLSQHQDMITTSLNYQTGTSQTEKDPDAKLRRSHGLLNMIGWGILLPIGAIIARYLKEYDPLWFYLHTATQSLGFGLGVGGVICGFVLNDRVEKNVDRHKAIGITILAFGCMQVVAILARPDKESKVRKYWNWYHWGFGRLLILLAAINVFYGIHLANAGKGWNAGYAVAIVLLFITSALLELRLWMKK